MIERIKKLFQSWKQKVQDLKHQTYAIFLAYQDPRMPWYAKVLAILVVGYAFSPIDLIPDFIPILGYLDDLILIPLGVKLVVSMIPPELFRECREKADRMLQYDKPKNWIAGGIILAVWIVLLAWLMWLFIKRFI